MKIEEANNKLDRLHEKKSFTAQQTIEKQCQDIFSATVRSAEIVMFEGQGPTASVLINVDGTYHARVPLTPIVIQQIMSFCVSCMIEPQKAAAE